MAENILFVDDDANILAGYKRQLHRKYRVHTALGGAEALSVMDHEEPFPVVISDMRMPEMDGIEFLSQVGKRSPDTIGIMLTGNSDQQTAVDAINKGHILRFYSKPCSLEDLVDGIEAGLKQHRLVTAERTLLEQTLAGSVKVLTDVLALFDPEGVSKARSVRDWSVGVAKWMNWTAPWRIGIAAMLSPIGHIALPEETIAKSRNGQVLTQAELDMIRRAPEISRNLIANIPRLKSVSETIYYQNKNFDGSGFPEDSVTGENIPQEARILRILNDLGDLIDIRTSEPPYLAEFDEMEKHKGRYDPKIFSTTRAFFVSQKEGLGDATGREALHVSIERIQPGDILVSNVKTKGGHLALAAGQEISPVLQEKLQSYVRVNELNLSVHILRPVTKRIKQPHKTSFDNVKSAALVNGKV